MKTITPGKVDPVTGDYCGVSSACQPHDHTYLTCPEREESVRNAGSTLPDAKARLDQLAREIKVLTPAYSIEELEQEQRDRERRVMGQIRGVKFDQEKVRWDLMPWDALEEVAIIMTIGAKKYADRNWEAGMEWSRLSRAAIGHVVDWFHCKVKGQDGTDPESKRSHLAHAACCVLFLLAYELRKMTKWDNRPNGNQP